MFDIDKNELIRGIIDKFESLGLEITFANYGGYKKPQLIKFYRPDVIGWDSRKELYYFGSATKSYDEAIHDKAKFDELSNFMMSRGHSEGQRIPLYVGVPKNEVEKIHDAINTAGVSIENINTIEVKQHDR